MATTAEQEELARHEGLFEKYRKARLHTERQWFLDLSYVYGRQNMLYYRNRNIFKEEPTPAHRIRYVANHILPIVRTLASKVIRMKPTWNALPTSDDREDINAARLGSKVLTAEAHRMKLQTRLAYLALWMITCGTAYLDANFDANAGDFVEEPVTGPDGQPLLNLMGQPVMKTIHMGWVQVEVVPAFNVYSRPGVLFDDSPEVIRTKLMTLDQIHQAYGKEVTPDVKLPALSQLEQVVSNVMGDEQESSLDDSAIVRLFHYKPCRKYPKGNMIVTANGKILADYGTYPEERVMMNQFLYTPILGTNQGYGAVAPLRPSQREYNRGVSQLLEHKNLLSKGKWLIPRECQVDPGAFSSEVGEKIWFNATGGFVPKQAELSSPPPFVIEILNVLRGDQMDISGVHEVSQAKVPPGVKSGKALSYLLEQDDSQMGLTTALFGENLNQTGSDILKLVKKYYNEPRLMRYYGTGHRPIVIKDFKGSMLRTTEDVFVEIGSALPSSRVARQDSVIELTNAMLMSPPEARKAMEFGQWEDIYQESRIDEEAADQENENMDSMAKLEGTFDPQALVGAAPDPNGIRDQITLLTQPNSWDAHLVHIQTHNRRRKRSDYENMPPIVKSIYEMHVNNHKIQYVAAAAEAAAPDMKAIKGGTDGPQDIPEVAGPKKSPSQTGEGARERTGGPGAKSPKSGGPNA